VAKFQADMVPLVQAVRERRRVYGVRSLAVEVREPRFVRPRTIVGLGLFLLAVTLPLLRQTGLHSWQTVFAEDGRIYTQQALRQGALTSLFHGYAGYLQLAPRLLALAVPLVPLRDLSAYAAVAGAFVTALAAAFVYRESRSWIRWVPLRLAIAALVVLMPALGAENTANMTNVIWVVAATAPWALLSLEEGRWDTAARVAAAFLAATSTALSVIFLPLAIAWVLIRRTRSAIVVASAFAVGLVVQGLVALASQDTTLPRSTNSIAQLRDEVAVHVFGVFLLGTRWIPSLWQANWWATALVPTLVVVAIFAVLFPGAGRRAQALAGVLVAYALVAFLFVDLGRGTRLMGLREVGSHWGGSERYSVIPVFFLACAAAVLADPRGEGGRRRVVRIAAPLLIAQIALVTIVSFPTTTIGSGGPDWRASMANTYAVDCHRVPSRHLVHVATNGMGSFNVTLPCRDLKP
jgi:hypothetical protein